MNKRTKPAHGFAPGSFEEGTLVLHALQRNGSNISATARDLKVSRVTLYRMMERNNLELVWSCQVVYTPGQHSAASPLPPALAPADGQ